ncbi:hypothetical protein GUITHDRAFT_122723 [Guillardia theta CCMP2712]|uniref:Uncharacterized protein n=1 Tax=Guillardia theta (strain CCMP2712) TaxID=905079 RepID=L1I5D8_GUITC|nr:hypothetical protein GUITHDRAFT_122723 [Guillardia theta CCMP2712]EKX31075.1 hypothetical protein GUITHDRAFT_122723 [Guillardia theta CCMP2712]|eukprot:XP_005818055.1 hypothetical protein GUITHDRAFT_122723 [Guillardia theta CCMP2712]
MNQEDPNARKRNVLNDEIAHYIYSCRAQGSAKPLVSSSELSLRYGITPKAIRDIWRRRTWVQATQSLWTRAERDDYNRREHSEAMSSDSKGRDSRGGAKTSKRETTVQVEIRPVSGAASWQGSVQDEVSKSKAPSELGGGVPDSTSRDTSQAEGTRENSWNEGWLTDTSIISKFLEP